MRKALSVITLAMVLLFAVSAMAQTKVVVIPLNSAKKLENVVTVSPKGGDFTDPVAAVNSITDAAADNPYLVIMGPGIYKLTETLIMKPYVYIIGSGQDATTLTGEIGIGLDNASSAIVSGSNNATLSDLTVENTGGSSYSFALYNNGSSPVIQNVTATATGGTVGNFGVRNFSSSPIMTNLTVTASGDTNNRGVFNSSSSPTMSNLIINASGGVGNNYGVNNSASSSPTMNNVNVTASGGAGNNYGVYNSSSSSIIRHCTLDGTTAGIYVSGTGTTTVIQSSIIGGETMGSGSPILTCVTSDNGVDTVLQSNCAILPP